MKPPAIVDRYRSEIDAELEAVINGRTFPMYDMLRYHLGWVDDKGNPVHKNGGKALRPSLCLFSCEAVGGDYHRALPAAAAVELVHNFSLIHDDIQDDDDERRHRPTVWAVWGKAQAINAGTAMRILANTALARLQDFDISMQKLLRVNQRLDEVSLSLIEGQYLDISFENRSNISVNDYLDMIKGKTGALISGSMELGASLGSDDENIVRSFREIGMNIGLAFQIKDDMLGIWGESEATGKPAGNDIRRRKKSFPVVWMLENVNGNRRKEVLSIYCNETVTDEAVERVLEIFNGSGVESGSRQLVENYCRKAEQLFLDLNLGTQAEKDMKEIIRFLNDRNY